MAKAGVLSPDRVSRQLFMAFLGGVPGFSLGLFPVFDRLTGILVSLALYGTAFPGFGVFYAHGRRLDATWGRGLRAERTVGDAIDHALTQRGRAVAHDVKEALGGQGNVDHVVMTPVGIRVVETKSDWLSKRRFQRALRQVADNVSRVRDRLATTLPVRGALVIANLSDGSYEADHDCDGEPVKAFGTKKFWRVLKEEREQTGPDAPSSGMAREADEVWNPGSTAYLDS